jgi:hypothetical protein
LQTVGANVMPDTSAHPLRSALSKLWAPVPWMLEAAIVLQLLLGKFFEAAIIAALLIFNAALGWFQESRAQATLAALRSRLALSVSARRDAVWRIVPAAQLVPGDLVKLSLGEVVAGRARALHVHPHVWDLPDGVRHRDAPNARVCCNRVRQSGDELHEPRAPTPVVLAPEYVGRHFVSR